MVLLIDKDLWDGIFRWHLHWLQSPGLVWKNLFENVYISELLKYPFIYMCTHEYMCIDELLDRCWNMHMYIWNIHSWSVGSSFKYTCTQDIFLVFNTILILLMVSPTCCNVSFVSRGYVSTSCSDLPSRKSWHWHFFHSWQMYQYILVLDVRCQ